MSARRADYAACPRAACAKCVPANLPIAKRDGRVVKIMRLSRTHLLSRCAFAAYPEQDRRGPWFYEVTPADRAKLHAVNLDANPLDALPLREMAEAIDDPFDDEHH